MTYEEWKAEQGAKMRRAIEVQRRAQELEDERRVRDSERYTAPDDWEPEGPMLFGSNATEELRRALE